MCELVADIAALAVEVMGVVMHDGRFYPARNRHSGKFRSVTPEEWAVSAGFAQGYDPDVEMLTNCERVDRRRGITGRYIHTVDTMLVMAADTVAGYIQGLLDGRMFKRANYALDRASREATLHRLFAEANDDGQRIAA